MDPITATGLAGNIFQFLDFGAKLVKAANELRHSPNTTENIHLLNNTSDLKRMSENISNSLEEGDDEQQFGQKSKARYLFQFAESYTHNPNRNSEVLLNNAPNSRNS